MKNKTYFFKDKLYMMKDFKKITLSEKSLEMCLGVVQIEGMMLKYVPAELQTNEICLAAIKQNFNALQYVKNQTEDLCWIALRINRNSLQWVKNQTEQMCFEVINSGNRFASDVAMSMIKNPTEEMISLSVDMYPLSIRWDKKQTREMLKKSIEKHFACVDCLSEKDSELITIALKQSKEALRHIPFQDVEICLEALKYFPNAYLHVTICKNDSFKSTKNLLNEMLRKQNLKEKLELL